MFALICFEVSLYVVHGSMFLFFCFLSGLPTGLGWILGDSYVFGGLFGQMSDRMGDNWAFHGVRLS